MIVSINLKDRTELYFRQRIAMFVSYVRGVHEYVNVYVCVQDVNETSLLKAERAQRA